MASDERMNWTLESIKNMFPWLRSKPSSYLVNDDNKYKPRWTPEKKDVDKV